MPDFAVATAFTATDKLSPAFKKMGRQADVFGSKGSRAMNKVSGAASNVKNSIMGMIPFLGVAGIGALGARAIELASDLTEVQNVVDTTFTKSSKVIDKWSQNAIEQFGLSELQAKKFAGTIGAMAKGAGVAEKDLTKMSIGLSGLAGDYASFYNLPIEEAFNKIRSGLSGESEPLKQIGKDMSVAGLKAFAMAQGITKSYESMNMAQKYQLRYDYLLSQSNDQMGDFNKTLATSYANQKRVLGVQFDQFLAKMATRFLPAITNAFKSLNDTIKGIDVDSLSRGLEKIISVIPYVVGGFLAWKAALIAVSIWQGIVAGAGWIKYLSQMAPIIMKAVKAQGFFTTMLKGTALWEGILAAKSGALAIAQGAATAATWLFNAALWANPITWIVVGIIALGVALAALVYYWDDVKAAFLGFFNSILPGLKTVGSGIMTALLLPINAVISAVVKLLQLASSIPIVGKYLGAAGDKLSAFQNSANSAVGATNIFAPNASQVESQQVRLKGEINISGAPQGTTVKSETRGAQPIKFGLMGA